MAAERSHLRHSANGGGVGKISCSDRFPLARAVTAVPTVGCHSQFMFVERTTKDGDEIIVLRYAAAFYWLMWPTLGLTVFAGMRSSVVPNIAAGVAWVLLLAVAVPYWPVIWRLKKRMRESSITASGSKYSFSNPLTYRWPQSKQTGSDG